MQVTPGIHMDAIFREERWCYVRTLLPARSFINSVRDWMSMYILVQRHKIDKGHFSAQTMADHFLDVRARKIPSISCSISTAHQQQICTSNFQFVTKAAGATLVMEDYRLRDVHFFEMGSQLQKL